jgi:hypothetical protein
MDKDPQDDIDQDEGSCYQGDVPEGGIIIFMENLKHVLLGIFHQRLKMIIPLYQITHTI